MWSRSAKFDLEIKGSFTNVVTAELFWRNESQGFIPIIGGDYTEDRNAEIRRTCSVVLDPTVIPAQSFSDDRGLWPTGSEIQLHSGIQFANGQQELIPVGRYRVSKPVITDTGDELAFKIDGYDRSRMCMRAGFTGSYQIFSGTDVARAIRDVLFTQVPWLIDHVTIDFMKTDGSDGGIPHTTPSMVFLTSDNKTPWAVAQELAASVGAELFFNQKGDLILRPEPTREEVDWDYSEGEHTNLLSVERSLDDDASYNGVILDSSNTELPQPIHAQVWDRNPLSPTYYDPGNPGDSIYGPYPYYYQSEIITTQMQAVKAAYAMLKKVGGIAENITFSAIPHPAHETGDVVRVKRARVNVDSTFTLDSLKIMLGHEGTMGVTTRTRRLT